jgi:hypothetical protein
MKVSMALHGVAGSKKPFAVTMPGRLEAAVPMRGRAVPRVPTGSVGTTLALAMLITVSTGFDYVWLGPVPGWIIVLAVGFGALVFHRRQLSLLSTILGRLRSQVITPWLALVSVMIVSDVYNDCLPESFSSIIVYDMLALVALLVAATLSACTRWGTTGTFLALVAGFQGLVAIGQYLEIDRAWQISEFLLSYTARGEQHLLLGLSESFEVAGRAKGSSIYVHKFAAFQGVLVAYLLVAIFCGGRDFVAPGRRRWAILILETLAVIGTILTFSRSAFLGMIFAVIIVMSRNFAPARWKDGLFLITFVALVLVALIAMDVMGSRHFLRLFDFSSRDPNNWYRYAVWRHGLEEFARSPILGVGSTIDTVRVGIALHSVPIRMLASYGLFGLACYLVSVAGVVRTLMRPASTAGLAGVVGFVVGLIDGSTHTSGFMFADIAQPVLVGVFLGQAVGSRADAPR